MKLRQRLLNANFASWPVTMIDKALEAPKKAKDEMLFLPSLHFRGGMFYVQE
jgi:hypothetical protein